MIAPSPAVFASINSSLNGLLNLGISFWQYGRHDRLIDYLAQSDVESFKFADCLSALVNRTPFNKIPTLGFRPQEATKFETAFTLMAVNNKAYELAIKVNPTNEDIDEFIRCRVGFTTAFTGKKYLMNHPEQVRSYRGLVPFGGPVKACFNTMIDGVEIKGIPDYKDYLLLRDITNLIADQTGLTSMGVNNWMFLQGQKLKQRETESK